MAINNLTGNDGRFGVTWPTVVREMLTQTTAADALGVLLRADLAGAHNYLILDAAGQGFNVEAMPSARPVQALGTEPLVHTNHVIHPAAKPYEGERALDMTANSRRRLEVAENLLANGDGPGGPRTADGGHPRAHRHLPVARRALPVGDERRGDHAAPNRRLLGMLGPARRERLRPLLPGARLGPPPVDRHASGCWRSPPFRSAVGLVSHR